MKASALLIVSMLVFVGSLTIPCVHAQDDVNPSVLYRIPCIADTYIDVIYMYDNYGTLNMVYTRSELTYVQIAFFKFSIDALPDNFVINSAVFNVFLRTVSTSDYTLTGFDNWILLTKRVERDWNETNLTFSNSQYNSNWLTIAQTSIPRLAPGTVPGYSFPDNDGVFHPEDPANYTSNTQIFNEYIQIDLTSLVDKWYKHLYPNYGVALVTYSQYVTALFHTREVLLNTSYVSGPPYLEVIGRSATTTVHLSYYNAFTGEGIAPWTFNVSARLDDQPFTRIVPDLTSGLFGENLTIRVLDFFGNPLYNETRMILSSTYYWDISLPVYSYKFYNQNPTFAKLEIFYNLAGTPYTEFIPPYESVNRYLKSGTYRFNITFYDEHGVQGDTYTWVRTIPDATFPGAGFVILTGTTINEVVSAVNGMQALVRVVAQLVSPSVIWVGRDLPQIPSHIMTVSNDVVVNNLYMLNAKTNQLSTGTSMTFASPIPVTASDSAIASDYFRFVGDLHTRVYINDTSNNMTVFSSSILPPSVAISGSGGYHVWANRTISCSREVEFRWYRIFTYRYYPAEYNRYEAEIIVQNTLSTPWMNATLFIPFMNNSYVNNRSVQVYDLNNTVNLVEGVHWVQSKQGVYLWFPQWNATVWRGFRLSYNAVNESSLMLPVTIKVNTVGDENGIIYNWQGDSFYFARASWVNTLRQDYQGPIYINLMFSMNFDASSVIVLTDGTTPAPITDFIVASRTVIIRDANVPHGEAVNYIILFKKPKETNIFEISYGGIPIISIAAFIALAAFVLGIYFTQVRTDPRSETFGRMFIGLAVMALFLIIVIFIYWFGVS